MTRKKGLIKRTHYEMRLDRTFPEKRHAFCEIGDFEQRAVFMKKRMILSDIHKSCIRDDSPKRLTRCMSNDLMTLDKALVRPHFKGLTIEIAAGFFRVMPRTPRTHIVGEVFNCHNRNAVLDLDYNRRIARHGISLKDFGTDLCFFDVIFGRVDKRATLESRHSRHGFARQQTFGSGDSAKTVYAIANNLEAILTSIEHSFFERVRFGCHKSFDRFATLEKVPQESRHDARHMLDKTLDTRFLTVGHEFYVFQNIVINRVAFDLKAWRSKSCCAGLFQHKIRSTQIKEDDNAWLQTFKIQHTDRRFVVSRFGFDDRCALLVRLSLGQRIKVFFVKVGFKRPATGQYINGLFVVNETSNDIEDLSLLTAV